MDFTAKIPFEQPKYVFHNSAITFEVLPPNRYKLDKKYRQLCEQHGENPDDDEIKRQIQAAKVVNAPFSCRILFRIVCVLFWVSTNSFAHLPFILCVQKQCRLLWQDKPEVSGIVKRFIPGSTQSLPVSSMGGLLLAGLIGSGETGQ